MNIKGILFSAILLLFAATVCCADEDAHGTITGSWIVKNKGPMTGGQVLLFNKAGGPPPSSDKFLRIPDIGTTIDSDGRFFARVAAGSYYLVMRKRANENRLGPPQDGDLQFYSRDKKGKARVYVVKAGGTTDIGIISAAAVFKKRLLKPGKGMTGIEGTVTDEQGLPVEGVRVFAYVSPEMKGKPLYASEGTGRDGRYFININEKGTYYLKVRNNYGGGKPKEGEFMGGYGKPSAPEIVTVQKGEIKKAVDIQTKIFIEQNKE